MTSLRAIPPDLDPACVNAIDGQLTAISEEHRVAIPLAIESGSRAWGFPSPDSDYDCRFIFVRSAQEYLSPWQKRDVIEIPLSDDLDINGWDLGKALRLVLKGNAVATEWLMSPIVYRGDSGFRTDMIEFARRFNRRSGIQRHYLHLGERQRRMDFADGEDVELKRLFYALRPAAALRWLRFHPDHVVVPMDFPTLMKECGPPSDVSAIAAELIERKAVTRELGKAPVPAPILKFVDAEFGLAREQVPVRATSYEPAAIEAAEEIFRRYLA